MTGERSKDEREREREREGRKGEVIENSSFSEKVNIIILLWCMHSQKTHWQWLY